MLLNQMNHTWFKIINVPSDCQGFPYVNYLQEEGLPGWWAVAGHQ